LLGTFPTHAVASIIPVIRQSSVGHSTGGFVSAHAASFSRALPGRLKDLRKHLFVILVLLIVCGAIFRSAVTTRLDGFTLDEAYHIAAGVSYIRNADFRINPEHPPLVKLWVGRFISATGFQLTASARLPTNTTSAFSPSRTSSCTMISIPFNAARALPCGR
jgi:hypothetical protein